MKQMIKVNMLSVFVLALIMSISFSDAASCGCGDENGGCCSTPDKNLAAVTWTHAVNDKVTLAATLKDPKIQMIEADIVMGVVVSQPPTPPPTESTTAKVEANQAADNGATNSDTNKPDASKPNEDKPDKVPIMAHPPAEQSDLSLVEFVATVAEHNAVTKHVKGIKLDFKSIEAVEASMPLIKSADVSASVWLNADILAGPGSPTNTPVNAKAFFAAVNAIKEGELKTATLSIGWTTNVGKDVRYTDEHVDQMIKTIDENKPLKTHPITFPVRAAIAAQSKPALEKLLKKVNETHEVSLTIWSAAKDEVDVPKLKNLINTIGTGMVYVDVPSELQEKLQLAKSSASSLVNFGLLNVVTFLFALFMRNGFY